MSTCFYRSTCEVCPVDQNKLEQENIYLYELEIHEVMSNWRSNFLCAFQRLNQIVNELEELKPEVLKKIEHMNFARQDAVLPSQKSTDNPSLARPTGLRNQSNLNFNIQKVLLPSRHNLFLSINPLFESSLTRSVRSTFCTLALLLCNVWLYTSLLPSFSSSLDPEILEGSTWRNGCSYICHNVKPIYRVWYVLQDYGLGSSSGRRDYLNRTSNTESPVFNPSYLEECSSSVWVSAVISYQEFSPSILEWKAPNESILL